MSSSLTLKVGNFTSPITFAKTDAEVAQVLRWFIANWADPEPEGLTLAQLNQWRLDQAAARIVNMVRMEAMKARLKELQAQQQNVEQAAVNDTAI